MSTTLPKLDAPAAYDIAEKSNETMAWLRNNIAVGFTSERGPAWHSANKGDPLDDRSHFDGPVPQWRIDEILAVPLVRVPMYAEWGGRKVLLEDRIGIGREDTEVLFQVFGEGYQIHQYPETLDKFLQAIMDQGIPVTSVGVLKKGAVAFIQARMPDHYEVEGFGFVPYIGIATSADGSLATVPHTGVVSEICDNTVRNGLQGAASSIRIKHSRNSKPRVLNVRDKLGLKLADTADDFDKAVRALMEVPVSKKDYNGWLDVMVPLQDDKGEKKTGANLTRAENKRETYTELYTKDEKVAPYSGSAFGIVQLDNTYRTWFGQNKVDGGGNFERNLLNVVTTKGAAEDEKAIKVLAAVQGG